MHQPRRAATVPGTNRGSFAPHNHAAPEVALAEPAEDASFELPSPPRIADYFLPGVSDYVKTPWVQAGTHITLYPGDWAAMPRTRISPRGLRATQSRLIKKHLARHLVATEPDPDTDVPWIVHYRGEHWVIDGHHRVAAAVIRDDEDIEVHLVDLDRR